MTTQNITLDETWQVILAGQDGIITMEGGSKAKYHLGTVAPALDTPHYSTLHLGGRGPQNIGDRSFYAHEGPAATETVYMQAFQGEVTTVSVSPKI